MKPPDDDDNGPPETVRYTLMVSKGEGVEGSHASGSYLYDAGTDVGYDFHALDDYDGLIVTLDGSPIAASGSFVMNADRSLTTSAARRVLWRYPVPLKVYYSSPAVGDDGTIYFSSGMTTSQGAMHAVDADGDSSWSYPVSYALFSPAIGNDGDILVQDYHNTVSSFTSAGVLNWQYDDYDNVIISAVGQRTPAVGGDGTIYVGAEGLHAVNPETGKRIWRFLHPTSPTTHCQASPVVADDGTIYVTMFDALFAVNPIGTGKWTFPFEEEGEASYTSPAIDDAGIIYLATEYNSGGVEASKVYAIDSDGNEEWVYAVEGDRFVRASPTIGPDGTIYIATKANGLANPAKLLALTPDGKKDWEFTIEGVHATPDDVYSTPSVGADGLIYFGAETGFIYAVKPDGTLDWRFDLKSGVNWSSSAIATDGTIYLGTWNDSGGYLLAIKSTSLGYAATPWPRFRHDRKNTGRF